MTAEGHQILINREINQRLDVLIQISLVYQQIRSKEAILRSNSLELKASQLSKGNTCPLVVRTHRQFPALHGLGEFGEGGEAMQGEDRIPVDHEPKDKLGEVIDRVSDS
jgi:hypothetical protein